MKKILSLLLAILMVAFAVAGCGTEKVENKVLTLSPYVDDGKEQPPVSYTGTFTGELKGGKPHGNGVFKFHNQNGTNVIYTGGFKDGKFDGAGILEYPSKKVVDTSFNFNIPFGREEANYKEGKYHGKLKRYTPDGKLYFEAEYKDGKFHGIVKVYNPKSGKLLGESEFKDGKANGKEKAYYETGQLKFDGERKEGKRTEGTLYNKDGSIQYQGKFVNGKPAR